MQWSNTYRYLCLASLLLQISSRISWFLELGADLPLKLVLLASRQRKLKGLKFNFGGKWCTRSLECGCLRCHRCIISSEAMAGTRTWMGVLVCLSIWRINPIRVSGIPFLLGSVVVSVPFTAFAAWLNYCSGVPVNFLVVFCHYDIGDCTDNIQYVTTGTVERAIYSVFKYKDSFMVC